MKPTLWAKEFTGSITISDANGIILEMNDKSVEVFTEDGGAGLIGSDVFDCHPEPSRTKLIELYKTQQTNIYTIEKKGKKKLIYQTPWYSKGRFAGYIELALEIPFDLPHFIRD
jgi:transcriptional regulator with PAS, ATPase and Fis domain